MHTNLFWLLAVLCQITTIVVLAKRRLEYDPNYSNGWRPTRPVPRPYGALPRLDPQGAEEGLQYGRPPQWLMPLFYTAGSDKMDGPFAGIAIRLSNNAFLAHSSSVNKAMSFYSGGAKPNSSSPAIIGFDVPDQVYDGEYPTKGNNYFPKLKTHLSNGIGVYQVGMFAHTWQTPEREFPISSLPRMPKFTEQWSDQCYLLSWGRRGGASDIYYLNQIYLKKMRKDSDCSGGVCRFDTVGVEPRTSGKVCGTYSMLGAPIICEQQSDRLSYVVTSTAGSGGCTQYIYALDLSKWSMKIDERVQAIESQKPPPPGAIG